MTQPCAALSLWHVPEERASAGVNGPCLVTAKVFTVLWALGRAKRVCPSSRATPAALQTLFL